MSAPTLPMSPVLFLDRLATTAGGALIEASWQAAVLALIVGAICLALGDRIPAAWRCVLWGVVFVRLVLPWTPSSSLSIYNIAGPWWSAAEPAPGFVGWVDASSIVVPRRDDAAIGQGEPLAQRRDARADVPGSTGERMAPGTPPLGEAFSPRRLGSLVLLALGGVWVLGAAGVLALLLLGHVRLRRVLRESTLLADARAAVLADQCRGVLGIAFPVALTENPHVQTPLVLGAIRPALVLPAGLAARMSERELRDVLLHELAHVKRHDILVSWMMSLALALHWFNPLAWIAASRWRAERELACDELALRALREPERTGYGRTLLKLVEHAARPPVFPAVAGIVENNADLKRRIAMIASFRPRSRTTAVAMSALVALAMVAGLTNAQPRDAKKPGAGVESPFRQGASDVRLYTQAYKDARTQREDPSDPRKSRDIWTLPAGVTLEVLSEYRGSGDNGKKYHDPRITIVAQDQANRFWAMIASLETEDAVRFRDELDKAIPERTTMLEKLGKRADDAEVKPARILSRDATGEFGELVSKIASRPTVSLRTKSEPILIELTSVPPGVELRSDIAMELTVPQAIALASALTKEIGRREVVKAIGVAGVPTTSGAIAGRDIITDHFMFPKSGIRANEHGVLLLPPRAVFAVSSDEKIVEAGKDATDFRVVITLKDEFNKVALVSRVPAADALAVARDIKKLAAEKRAAGAVPGTGDSDIVVAPQIYKVDNGGMAHVAGVGFVVLPGYNGIGEKGERITDDRITLVINDRANGFWPLVARLDLAVAEKLAMDIERGRSEDAPK